MSEAQRYAAALNQEGRNLSRLAADHRIPLPSHREAQVAAVLDAIRRGRSVMLVGESGVGKTTILHGVACELREAKRELWELASMAILTGTRYLGEWQSKTEAILESLRSRRGLWYVPDVWNLLNVGTSTNDPSCLLDLLRPRLQSGQLQLIGEVTPERFQALQAAPLLLSLFDVVHVAPLDDGHIAGIAAAEATRRQVPIDASGIAELMALCRRFLPGDHGPGQVLRLVQQVGDYRREKIGIGEPEDIDRSFIEKVFSIYSGLPRFVVSRSVTIPAREIRDWFQQRIIGQERAVAAVVEVITLFKAGLHDPRRPVGTLLFVGPTGVGKTELAKAIASYLFGSEARMLRFDLSEFKDYHAFQLLVGNPDRPLQPARLLDPVRAQPFQVILFDEIEKAHPNVWDMLLQLLDEGHVSPPHGARANFRNTIVIATSNVGSQDALKAPIGFMAGRSGEVPMKSLESVFRPELLNRFQHIVTFDGLSRDNVRRIARREIQQLLAREGITSRNLAVEVGDDVLDAVVDSGYDREYGARALKRQVQQRVLFPIAGRLMETEVPPGSILKLEVEAPLPDAPGATRVRVLDTQSSRELQRAAIRQRSEAMQGASRAELAEQAATLATRCSALATNCGSEHLLRRLDQLDSARRAAQFWKNLHEANAILVEIDELKGVLERLDSLRHGAEALVQELRAASNSRQQLDHIERRLVEAAKRMEAAERELTRMGAEGRADVLVAIAPIGGAPVCRDLLLETYGNWARWRGHPMQLLCDPVADGDPAFFAVRGAYAFGHLRHECGVHRLRRDEEHEAVRVSVAAWSHAQTDVEFGNQRALKQPGRHGERIRSCVEVSSGTPFTLRNHLTIAENRELARAVSPSWNERISSDAVVRRYDLEPFLLKDHLTGVTSGRRSSLKPEEFHALLCQRVDAAVETTAMPEIR
jgi:ATP-dependent Clp protease ATP-binding subunit ClpC